MIFTLKMKKRVKRVVFSEFVVHYFNKVSDLFVLGSLHKPLSKVTLDRHVEHLLLFTCETSCPDLLLHLYKLL